MKSAGQLLFLVVGIGLGVFASAFYFAGARPAEARPNDRVEEYVMCTGPCALTPKGLTDGVWILDFRGGKLLGTVIDRNQGKIVGFAEVDLTAEFNIQPKSNVHFMMTTGVIAAGQAALYIAETASGRLGVYTLGPDPNAANGITIRRHDMVPFRK